MSRTQYEILALALRYWFLLLAAYICVRAVLSLKRPPSRWRQFKSMLLLVLFTGSAFALLGYRQGGAMDIEVMLTGAAAAAALMAQFLLVWMLFRHAELDLLIVSDALLVLGIVMLERLTPDMAMRQVQWLAGGSILLGAGIITGRYLRPKKIWIWLGMAASLALLLLPFLFGEEIRGARNWVTIAGAGFQPSEFVKVGLVLILAGFFSMSERFREYLPAVLFAGLCVVMVVFQKDLGAALIYFAIFLFMQYAATGDWIVSAGALGTAGAGAVAGYFLFDHVRARVLAWRNPFAIGVEYNSGYQIVQSLIAIASGGLFGSGLGMGSPAAVPAADTDFIFSAICEEMGILMGVIIMVLFAVLVAKGIKIARRAPDAFSSLICAGAAIALGIQGFIILGGVTKLIPLTGVTLPFVSYGGSSMLASFFLLGLIEGVSMRNHRVGMMEEDDEDLEDEEEEDAE